MALLASTIQTIMGVVTGVESSQTTIYANLLYWIQHALDDLYARDWNFNRVSGQFTTVAPYETGTITATAGSTTVTGDGTTWDTDWVDAYIPLNGTQHHIASVESSTSLTLSAAPEASLDAGSSYAIYFPSVELAAILARLSSVQGYPHEQLHVVTPLEADDLFLDDPTREYATHAALLSPGSTTKYSRIKLYPFPTEAAVYTYHGYRAAPTLAAGTETGIPDAMRELLVAGALQRFWASQDKQQQKSAYWGGEAARLLAIFIARESKAGGPRQIRGFRPSKTDVPGFYSTYDRWS